ncbi:MAG: hypothetical protein IJG32_05235, partial [Selenomonadaceae bacterium]|nr:hypothetical protein [Selenomonadaceae bacterium]
RDDELLALTEELLDELSAKISVFLGKDAVFEQADVRVEPDDEIAVAMDKALAKPIEELELSVRSTNCLKRAGIHIVADLVDKTEEEMMKFRNLGRKSFEEIKQKMGELGVSFRQPPNVPNLNMLDE